MYYEALFIEGWTSQTHNRTSDDLYLDPQNEVRSGTGSDKDLALPTK